MERSPCTWIGRINIVKMAILPKAIYRFNVIHIKISTQLFPGFEKTIFTTHRNKQTKPRTAKTILNKRGTARDIIILEFKLNYKAIVIKTACY